MGTSLEESLVALGAEGVDLWYLHAPDRSVPLEETARAVHELFQEGGEGKKFKRWGVSNFMAWEGMLSLHPFIHSPPPTLPPFCIPDAILKVNHSRSNLRDLQRERVPTT